MKLKGTFVELKRPRKIYFHPVILDTAELKPSEIIAETVVTAISPGTEVSAYKGDPALRPGKVYPRLVGYCNVAKILHIGDKVRGFRVGDMILTDQSHRSIFKISAGDILAKIPDGVSPEHASVAYLYNLGLISLENAGVKKGSSVAVLGLGVLGLGTVAEAKLLGANVAALSASRFKLRLAKKLGARTGILKNSSGVAEKVRKSFGGNGADVVVTTSNSWADWKIALQLARKNGTISVLGFPGRNEGAPDFNPLDPAYLYVSKLRIISADAGNYPGESRSDLKIFQTNCQKILKDIAGKKLNPKYLISGIYPAKDIEKAYKKIMSGDGKSVTYLLK